MPRLHVLTGPHDDAGGLQPIEQALAAGAPAIQIRLKNTTDAERFAVTEAITARCRAAGALAIVNDRVDLALAVGADGVHLGAADLPVPAARAVAGSRLLIGGTARDPAQARALVAQGVDYLGVGPTCATTTKSGLPEPIGVAGVAAVAAAVTVPVLAIAGITAQQVTELCRAGVHGVAVTAAVTRAPDPGLATRDLLAALGEVPVA